MLRKDSNAIPIKVVTIPVTCCLVTGSLKKIKAKITKRVGLAPAIGATIVTRPLLIPKL